MSSSFELPSYVDSFSYVGNQDYFDRLKATSQRYGLYGKIKNLIRALFKKMGIGLPPQRETKHDLYNQHAKLCSKIRKVSEAYRAYRRAENRVQLAQDLKADSQWEFYRAEAFVKSYDALIDLALQQSARFGVSRNPYLRDIHDSLAQKGDIFPAVHRARAKLYLGNGLFEGTQKRYVDFVGSFTQHVRQAAQASGSRGPENIQVIADGLIDGLASISGVDLAPSIRDAIIKLNHLQNPSQIGDFQEREALEREVAQLKDEVVQSLSQQLLALISRDKPLSIADLEKIQHRGISLFSVLGYTEDGVESLEKLQVLWKSLQEVQKQARFNLDQQRQLDRSIIIDSTLTVAELQELSAPEDLSPDYTKFTQDLAALDKKISSLKEAEEKELAALSITKQRQQVKQLEASFHQLNTDVQALSETIKKLQRDLVTFKAEDPVKQFNSLSTAEQRKNRYLYGYDCVKQAEQRYQAEIKKQAEAIREKTEELRMVQRDLSHCQMSLNTAKAVLHSLFDDEVLETSLVELEIKIRINKELKLLTDERKKITDSFVKLSEEELQLLADRYPEGALGDQVRRGCGAFSKKPTLMSQLQELNGEAQEIKKTLSRQYPHFDPETGKFSEDFFEIRDLLQSNFAIAQEIHARVSDRLGRRCIVPYRRMSYPALNPMLSGLVNPFANPHATSSLSTSSTSDYDSDYSSEDLEGEIDLGTLEEIMESIDD